MALRFFHPFLLEYYRYLIQVFQRNERLTISSNVVMQGE